MEKKDKKDSTHETSAEYPLIAPNGGGYCSATEQCVKQSFLGALHRLWHQRHSEGWLARKLKCATRSGALLDSLADLCFVVCCAWKLLPILELPQWLWLWAGVIVVIKVVNQLSALVMYGRCCFPHTLANKWAGILLFIAVPMTFCTVIPIAIVAFVATFAAIQEGHFIRTRNNVRIVVTK